MIERGYTTTGTDGVFVRWEADPDKLQVEVSVLGMDEPVFPMTGTQALKLANAIRNAVKDAKEEHCFLTNL